MSKRILIGGGGTGGHVFPAISVANAIKGMMPDAEILFVGARGKLEMEKVPEAGYQIEGLPVTGFQRKLTVKNISFFFNLIRSFLRSKRIIKEFRPSVALGVGGYASGPVIKAAARAGVPVVIQEQNSCAGITNRLLAKHARLICVAYEGMEKYFPAERIIITGNPVRGDIITSLNNKKEGLAHFGLSETNPVVLVIGGSLGARTINQTIGESLPELPDSIQFLWQTGKLYFEEALEKWKLSGKENVKVLPFIRDMALAYGCADIIVSRAGAGTISELAIAGKPVILVPSPNVAEDHQTKNALALASKNAAILVPDADAGSTLLKTVVQLVQNPEICETLSQNIRKLAIPDAAERIAREIKKMAGI